MIDTNGQSKLLLRCKGSVTAYYLLALRFGFYDRAGFCLRCQSFSVSPTDTLGDLAVSKLVGMHLVALAEPESIGSHRSWTTGMFSYFVSLSGILYISNKENQ